MDQHAQHRFLVEPGAPGAVIAWHGAGFIIPLPTTACFAASAGVNELLMIDLKRPALEARDQLAAELDGVADRIKAAYQE